MPFYLDFPEVLTINASQGLSQFLHIFYLYSPLTLVHLLLQASLHVHGELLLVKL